MAEILVTCTDCGTTLKVSGEAPHGRFVRCPSCTTIFIAVQLERSPPAGAQGPRLTCTDCGAVQYSVQPVAGGKFVRCVQCAAVFRVPGNAVADALAKPVFPQLAKSSPSASFDAARPAVVAPKDRREIVEAKRLSSPPTAARLNRTETGAAVEPSPKEQRRRFQQRKSDQRVWVPIVVCSAVGIAAVAMAVLLFALLRPSSKEPDLAKANTTRESPGARPEDGLRPATTTQAEPPVNPGVRSIPPPLPNRQPQTSDSFNPPPGSNDSATPRTGRRPEQPIVPGVEDPGDGSARPPALQMPPPRPGGAQPLSPLQRFQPPPDMLPGGMARRFQRGGQPEDNQPPSSSVVLPGIFNVWNQDFEIAKREAARAQKDILALFVGSDWSGISINLSSEVFARQDLIQKTNELFFPVYVDFPKQSAAQSHVRDPARNRRLATDYGVETFPTVVLADPAGHPYAIVIGYRSGSAADYWQHLIQLRDDRRARDTLLQAVDQSTALAKLQAAEKFVNFLEARRLSYFYLERIKEWLTLARSLDGKNTAGALEVFFEALWIIRVTHADSEKPAELQKLISVFLEWKKEYRFKDPNRAARMHTIAAMLLLKFGAEDAAERLLTDALDYNPTDAKLLAFLKKAVGGPRQGQGTGFVVSANGHILTNSHVIHGNGPIQVFLPARKEPLPAQLVAEDVERDMAIIRVSLPTTKRPAPLSIVSDRKVNRGESAAALGYPLSDITGTGMKLTTGVISALPEAGNQMTYLLDIKINPGNSGGPLCDAFGNVIGMVAMKTINDDFRDSYGMAIPAPYLLDFLKRHIKSYKSPARKNAKKQWDEIDGMVSPSVVMILKTTGVN